MDSQPSSRRRRANAAAPPSVGSMVTAAVVAYGTYRLANWAWNAWNSADNDRPERAPRVSDRGQTPSTWRLRRQRLERCREETANAMEDFLPTLRQALEERTDSSEETRQLKKIRAEKRRGLVDPRDSNDASGISTNTRQEERDLWDVVKVQTFTRMVATAYAHTILFLVLTVQVNLLGGRLFGEQVRTQTSTQSSASDDSIASGRMSSYQASHRLVLTQTYEYFFQRGISSLVHTVERAVANVLQEWDVMDPSSLHTSRDMMEEAIDKIRDIVEGRTPRRRSVQRPRSILRFLLPPEQNFNATVPDELAQSILDETWDLLESPVLEDAQYDSLNMTFDIMRDHFWGTIFAHPDGPRHASTPWITKPLAHVITQLKTTSMSFYKPPETSLHSPTVAINCYLAALEKVPAILELGDVSFN